MLHPALLKERSAFAPRGEYRLLPFRFEILDDRRYIVTNDVGEYVVLAREDLVAFSERRLPSDSALYRTLKARHVRFDESSDSALDLVALKYERGRAGSPSSRGARKMHAGGRARFGGLC